MPQELPKKLYVKWDEDDTPFLLADPDYTGLSIQEEVVEVGEYELKAVRKLTNTTKLD